jgi:hypothetical protein
MLCIEGFYNNVYFQILYNDFLFSSPFRFFLVPSAEIPTWTSKWQFIFYFSGLKYLGYKCHRIQGNI